jgi:hypothetical protein
MQFLIKWVTIVIVFGGFIYFMTGWKNGIEQDALLKVAPYTAEVERYLKKKSVAKEKIPAHGHVLFVDEKTRTVDKFSDHITDARNRPTGPADVDSAVLHNCDYVEVGMYTNGARAMQHVCNFTVVDVASGAWSNWGEFRGTMPPQEVKRRQSSSSDETGGLAVYSFLAAGGLARETAVPK